MAGARLSIVAGAMLGCFLASNAMTGAAKAADSIPQTVADATMLVQDGMALARSGDTAASEAKLRLVLASPAFSQLPPNIQYDVPRTIGTIEFDAKNFREARDMFKRACESPAPLAPAWVQRLVADRELDDADGVGTLTALAEQAPQVLPQISPYLINWAAEKSVQVSDDAAIELIGALHAAHWRNPDRYRATDVIWLYLARAYLDRGNTKAAAEVMADVTSVAWLLAARSEKLFDPVVAADPAHYDIAKAAEAEIVKYQKWAKEDPDRLEAVSDLVIALTLMRRYPEAIAVADAALAHVQSGAAPLFTDKSTSLGQLMDVRSDALFDAGRIPEALDQISEGAHVSENGQPNVSQVIDLADTDLLAGKPREALTAVAILDPNGASPYGVMAAANARACAYAQLNDTGKLTAEITYMRAHEDDAPTLLLDAYVCSGDMDSAAGAVIAFIRDPLTRSRMLITLQDYAGSEETPIVREYKRKYVELRNRPDVAAAILAIGHINSYPINWPSD